MWSVWIHFTCGIHMACIFCVHVHTCICAVCYGYEESVVCGYIWTVSCMRKVCLWCVCACMCVCIYTFVQRICEGPVVCGGPALANGVYEGHVHTCRCLPAGRELSSRPCSPEDKHRPPACRALGLSHGEWVLIGPLHLCGLSTFTTQLTVPKAAWSEGVDGTFL